MLTALAKDLEERFHDKNAEHTYLEIAHTCNEEGAKELEEALKEQYPGVPITIAPLSLSIACHIGPGSFAVACSSKLKELGNNLEKEKWYEKLKGTGTEYYCPHDSFDDRSGCYPSFITDMDPHRLF